ncbi:Helix-turn-helix domain-containing protein [Butyrivibrio hungatei DSM 14810]|uniref:Stage 0 sporulation protein A homolog n=2 Tax=Butyrivibrio hungatei TaxID=185008 RepID=A0A1D9P3I4_9FIRM|nr:response regulator [Butyrivibrio hungatei]AOZ97071.1 two component system response regulator [Butyrivibrio hungatei]SHN49857.1 Helix-turn-helix domain-containing protein [Butyrivibrio hungatei DSM 14810]
MTLLIVDDEPYMVDYIAGLLDWQQIGFDKVLTAGGGSLALDLIKQHSPELLITDIKMPRISGLDLAEYIDENKLNTKVVILTGYSDFEYAQKSVHLGVTDYLVKPILKDDFQETINRIMEKYFSKECKTGENSGVLKDKKDVVSFVQKYVIDNCEEELSLEMLSGIVHLHPAYLSKIFKEVSGVGLLSYITDAKMQRAAKLLEETDMKVADIVTRLGYHKYQYFSKLFRDKYGISPKVYRLEKRFVLEK